MIQNFAYLIVLLFALGCLGLTDYRYKLALFFNARHTVVTLLIGLVFFLLWDISGVALSIFFIGGSKYLSGLTVLPEVPIEEIFFLLLLNYNALLLWRGGLKLWLRT